MDKLTTTIKREWLSEIAAKTKKIEYRQIKPYWTRRLESVGRPFLLRLINGMTRRAPEVTVIIDSVRKNKGSREYELHIAKVVQVKNWNAKRRKPVP